VARPRTNFARKTRSVKTWLGTAAQGQVGVSSGAKVLLSSTAGFGLGSTGTIIRTRGILHIVPQVFTADLAYDGAFGIGVVSQAAQALGITALPGPFTDDDWSGWFVHQYYSGEVLATAVDAGYTMAQSFTYEIDSKAMRKVAGDEAIVLVAQSRTGVVNIVSHMRILFQES